MSSALASFSNHHTLPPPKPLPPVSDKLPPPPPSPDQQRDSFLPPPPPPKIVGDESPSSSPASPLSPASSQHASPLPSIPSLGNFDGLNVPLTPTSPGAQSPGSPMSPSTEDAPVLSKPKKSNPLVDLVETEKQYVDHLTGIIRKVAAAWSRSNLPPPELDIMFRAVEAVYKANRGLLSKLKEIGTNPSSPKALGDLLMRWIDDLDVPYTGYCTKYRTGFDTWGPVMSNSRLPGILQTFSAAHPPSVGSPTAENGSALDVWTLDGLFQLPQIRVRYYRKLYARLLKSTQPGRSDHRLLVGALEKLDGLLATVEQRSTVRVGADAGSGHDVGEDEVVIDLRDRGSVTAPSKTHLSVDNPVAGAESASSSARGSSSSMGERSGERSSRETASTSVSMGRASTSTLNMPITDLERRLSTERTLDIFTMKPKSVRLQMSPPSLNYTRALKVSMDVTIRVTPRATGTEVVHGRGHIFLLSDLFLVCERMTPAERMTGGGNGPDMWLLYPPLAGKVLRVSEAPEQSTTLQVAIMRKETLFLQTDSMQARDNLIADFKECIDFASSMFSAPKDAPPLPPLATGSLPRSPSAPLPGDQDQRPRGDLPPLPGRNSGQNMANSVVKRSSSPVQRALSPRSAGSGSTQSPPPGGPGPMSIQASRSMTNLASQNGERAGPFPARSASTARSDPAQSPPPFSPPPASIHSNQSFAPGQVMPPVRNNSLNQHQPPPAFGPGQIMPPQPGSFTPGQVMPPTRSGSSHSMPTGADRLARPAPPPSFGGPPGPPGPPHHPGPGIPPGAGFSQQLPPPRSAPPNGPGPNYAPNQQFPPRPQPPYATPPSRPGSDPTFQGGVRQSPSSLSMAHHVLPMPPYGQPPQLRPILRPSEQLHSRSNSPTNLPSFHEPSPPNSPVEETPRNIGPVTSTISAQMKCKVFLKQHHAQWKNMGSAKLRLYRESPTNIKQLVVEADNKASTIIISTIVLTDGVERVGKTGVAVELSDKGQRTGIVYMIQLRNETSAGGLFDSLIAGSDRA